MPKIKILIVEDQEVLAEHISDELSQYGYDVECVNSSEDACLALDGKRYDVVLSDIHMPGINGIQFNKMLREEKIPCASIAMSGLDIEMECKDAGFLRFLPKPFSPQQLLAVIGSVTALN